MRLTIGMMGVVAATLLAQTAVAAPVDYDCDTPAGSFSEISQVQVGPAVHVRGTITALQWREDRRWSPLGQVRVENGDRTRSIAVRVVRIPRQARATFDVTVQTGGEPQTTRLGEVALNEAVPFELQLLPSGDAIAVVGGERRVFRLDLGRNVKIKTICSTGEFLFGGLDLGG